MGSKHSDPHLCDFLDDHFLKDQVETINKLAKHQINLIRLGGGGVGLFIFDKELRS
jgi:ferritin heavy chain